MISQVYLKVGNFSLFLVTVSTMLGPCVMVLPSIWANIKHGGPWNEPYHEPYHVSDTPSSWLIGFHHMACTTPALVDLKYKYPCIPSTHLMSCTFMVFSKVHQVGGYLGSTDSKQCGPTQHIYQIHDELANSSLICVCLLRTMPTSDAIAISLDFLELYHCEGDTEMRSLDY